MFERPADADHPPVVRPGTDPTSRSDVDHGGAAVDALVSCGRVVASAQARLLAAMVAVADGSVGVGFDADEVAFALHVPRQAALREVMLGRDLIDRLPAVFAALEAGRIDLARARVFSDLLTDVEEDDLARGLADQFLPPAEGWTASELRKRLQRAILAADPDAAGQRYERSVRQRRVELTSNPDTTAQLSGLFLPPAKAAAAFERVDALARGFKNGGDERTLGQLRADVFCGLLAGTLPLDCPSPVHRPGVVELLVPLATLTGAGDGPGTLGGYGPVVADIARQVAADAAARGSGYQWRYSVYDSDGRLLHHGTTRARPTTPSAEPTCPTSADAANPARGTATTAGAGMSRTMNAPHDSATDSPAATAIAPAGATPDVAHGTARDGSRGAANDGSRGAALDGSRGDAATADEPPMAYPPVQDDETARFPNPALRRWTAARDRTCRAPGCTAPARSCDVDHTIDHTEAGPTRHDNLGLLCRHHHKLKHEGGFTLSQPEPGHFIWRSPSGETYSTDPDPPG